MNTSTVRPRCGEQAGGGLVAVFFAGYDRGQNNEKGKARESSIHI